MLTVFFQAAQRNDAYSAAALDSFFEFFFA
jgi:hypothetical protein